MKKPMNLFDPCFWFAVAFSISSNQRPIDHRHVTNGPIEGFPGDGWEFAPSRSSLWKVIEQL
jgi:hypothetical protein